MTSNPSQPARGVGLGIAGQACFIGAWLLGALGAITQSPIGLIGIAAGVTGIVLSAIAFFFVHRRWGVFSYIAGWLLSAGAGAAMLVFLVIPGSNEWGKLGAIVVSMATLAVTLAASHLVAAIGLMRGGSRELGIAAIAIQSLGILAAVMTAMAVAELWLVAAGAAFIGHALLFAGFIVMRQPVREG